MGTSAAALDRLAMLCAREVAARQPQANATINQLPPISIPASTDAIAIYRNGATYQTTMGGVEAFINANTPAGFGWFNVVTYGAALNGVTDDTAAWQACINACYAAGGGVVFSPPGVSIVNGVTVPMTFCSNVAIWILGSGMGVTTLQATTSGIRMFTFQGNGGVSNLTFDGNSVALSNLYCGSATAGYVPPTNLTSGTSASATALPVTAGTGSAYVVGGWLLIDLGLATQERVQVTGVAANLVNVTATRNAHLSGAQIQQPVVNYQYVQHVESKNVNTASDGYAIAWVGSGLTGYVDCWYASLEDCNCSNGTGYQDLTESQNCYFFESRNNWFHDSPRNAHNSFNNWIFVSTDDMVSNVGWPGAADPISYVVDAPNAYAYITGLKIDSASGYALFQGIHTELNDCHIDTAVLLCASDYIGHGVYYLGVAYAWPGNTTYAKLRINGGKVGYLFNSGLPGQGYGYTPGSGCSGVIEAYGATIKPGNPIYAGGGQVAACIENIQTSTSNSPTFDSMILNGCILDSSGCSAGASIASLYNMALTNSRIIGCRTKGTNAATAFSTSITYDTGSASTANRFYSNDFQPVNLTQPTVGASVWTYTNTTGFPVSMYVGGGTVTGATYVVGSSSVGLPVDTGYFKISVGAQLKIQYSSVPTVYIFDAVA
jgi:hypothetical protein